MNINCQPQPQPQPSMLKNITVNHNGDAVQVNFTLTINSTYSDNAHFVAIVMIIIIVLISLIVLIVVAT